MIHDTHVPPPAEETRPDWSPASGESSPWSAIHSVSGSFQLNRLVCLQQAKDIALPCNSLTA